MRRSFRARWRAAVLPALLLVTAAPSARGQGEASCTFGRCGLRMEGRFLLRGSAGDTIARPRWWYDPQLPLSALVSDSSRRLAARFNRDGHRAKSLAAIGALLLLGGVTVAYGHDADWGDMSLVDRGDAAGLWGTRVAVSGLALTLIAAQRWSRAVVWRDRALWVHNQGLDRPSP